jgi:hypothetical protein
MPSPRRVLRSFSLTTGPTGPTGVKQVEDEVARARRRNATTDSRLRQWLGYGALIVITIQLVAVDYLFFRYAIAWDWKMPVEAIIGWLGATLGQIFVILRGLGRYLFPPINPDGTPADRP